MTQKRFEKVHCNDWVAVCGYVWVSGVSHCGLVVFILESLGVWTRG